MLSPPVHPDVESLSRSDFFWCMSAFLWSYGQRTCEATRVHPYTNSRTRLCTANLFVTYTHTYTRILFLFPPTSLIFKLFYFHVLTMNHRPGHPSTFQSRKTDSPVCKSSLATFFLQLSIFSVFLFSYRPSCCDQEDLISGGQVKWALT